MLNSMLNLSTINFKFFNLHFTYSGEKIIAISYCINMVICSYMGIDEQYS